MKDLNGKAAAHYCPGGLFCVRWTMVLDAQTLGAPDYKNCIYFVYYVAV